MKITKSKHWYWRAFLITSALAWIMCIVPTVVAGIIKLPAITTKSETETLTGAFTLVLICAAYPLLKGLLKLLKSPSAWLILWLLTGVTFLLWKVTHETIGAMLAVLLTAAIGNSIGAILFLIAKTYKEKWKFCGEVSVVGGSINA